MPKGRRASEPTVAAPIRMNPLRETIYFLPDSSLLLNNLVLTRGENHVERRLCLRGGRGGRIDRGGRGLLERRRHAAVQEHGADVIELGVPFSDPLADGPTIQRASERALKAGASLAGVLDLVRRIRRSSQVPLVLFSYFNPIVQMGLEKFAHELIRRRVDSPTITAESCTRINWTLCFLRRRRPPTSDC